MRIEAWAKINWDLRVMGRRADGFHELDTVMATVGLSDTVEAEASDSFSFSCSDKSLPTDERNLAVRAAQVLARAAGRKPKAILRLEKRIPAGGGLGGGSADAAAVLRLLNHLWGLNWSRERLAESAAELGSDVPYFLWGGWCRCRGRGEVVEPLPESKRLPTVGILLIIPELKVDTPKVYSLLAAEKYEGKKNSHRFLTSVAEEVRLSLSNVNEGKWFCGFGQQNDLLSAACSAAPVLCKLQAALEEVRPGRWGMSGSGAVHFVPTAIGELEKERTALEAVLTTERVGKSCQVVAALVHG